MLVCIQDAALVEEYTVPSSFNSDAVPNLTITVMVQLTSMSRSYLLTFLLRMEFSTV